MTTFYITYDKPTGERRCISGIAESDGQKRFQSHYDLTKAYPLSYKEKESAKTILQKGNCKNITVKEERILEFA